MSYWPEPLKEVMLWSMDITEVTAPTEREVKELFNRINVFILGVPSSFHLFVSSREYLANEHIYTDVGFVSPNGSPVRVIWGSCTSGQAHTSQKWKNLKCKVVMGSLCSLSIYFFKKTY